MTLDIDLISYIVTFCIREIALVVLNKIVFW